MKHFFLINFLLLSALALLLLMTSGEPIIEHLGERCNYNGACKGSEKCYESWCANYNGPNFNCRDDSDCTASQICRDGTCQTKTASDKPNIFPAGENDPRWLLTRPNNRNFCPGEYYNFCGGTNRYCRYGETWVDPWNRANMNKTTKYYCNA
jgi:hypothetical protein